MAQNTITRAQRHAILEAVKDTAREPYAWPGSYPKVVIMRDGALLCPNCARREFPQLARALYRPGSEPGWEPASAEVNWESQNESCCHCGADLVLAYWEH